MPNTLPTLYCPNPRCQAKNTELDPQCQECGSALPKRYLWVMGLDGKPGETLADRYAFRGPNVVLDTQINLPLKLNTDLPNGLIPYLKLFPYRLHVPQLYTVIPPKRKKDFPIVLLEQAPLSAADFFETESVNGATDFLVSPGLSLIDSWPYAQPLRQVNWLWQMAQLWQPFLIQGVASTLLQPDLLRVEERLLRVLELHPEFEETPTLAHLGSLWQQWLPGAAEPLAPDFEKLCQALIQGSLSSPELLLDQLEQLLVRHQEPYQLKIDISARTDTGQMRNHNEDACYPGHTILEQNSLERLAVVCDGVGGHDGGEVASAIAIEAMTSHLTQLQQGALPTDVVIAELEAATFQANDLISERNDEEKRQERRRMGTTLVTTLIHNQQAYLTHIGDSRAYLITAVGCYQLTVDDDIASREVRLGYIPYRDALKQPASGSLTQALGMAPSSVLRPTVQRLVLDEDCVILLCSDGLSDYDRVEALWRTEVLPLLRQETDLVTVTKRLIEQANELNGHDNITVALLHCRVDRSRVPRTTAGSRRTQLQSPVTTSAQPAPPAAMASPSDPASGSWKSWALAGLLGALALAGLAYFFLRPKPDPFLVATSTVPEKIELSFEQLAADTLLEIQPSNQQETALQVWPQSQPPTTDPGSTPASIPFAKGSIVRIVGLLENFPDVEPPTSDADVWLKIQICSPVLSSNATPGSVPGVAVESEAAGQASPLLEEPPTVASPPGETSATSQPQVGWVRWTDLQKQVVLKADAPAFSAPFCGRSVDGIGEVPIGGEVL
ncbi:Serine/threonine phosphatase stp [Acaryochloris thomasi RCC1774]|uniref:Serine/threonine phosphatase stp n=1 Tax=Acaryochloris thomasi RCC1774 TaxID=1764569 RepID=A0A2W1JYX5_9CYAN|nr:protein phosphatase 2C domain-containing protein [Acaryochloris thomasi]PZD73701.1 Serine/threonine phosphatase stp [Acaryochloris thomasi RCC1774]